MPRIVMFLLVAALAVTACGADDDASSALPHPDAAVPAADRAAPEPVATVDGVAIGRAAYDRWLRAAGKDGRKASQADRREQVMQFLLTQVWLEREAQRRGVTVSPAEVDRAFERQRRASFPQPGEFERFLRRSGMTRRMILERVRGDQLAERLRPLVGTSKKKVAAYRRTWRQKTTCAPDYVIDECGNSGVS